MLQDNVMSVVVFFKAITYNICLLIHSSFKVFLHKSFDDCENTEIK